MTELKNTNILTKEEKNSIDKDQNVVSSKSKKQTSDTKILNKSDIIKSAAEQTGLPIKSVRASFDSCWDVIINGLAEKNKIMIVGILTAYTVDQKKQVRNPNAHKNRADGAQYPEFVKPKYDINIKMKAGQTLKERVNSHNKK